MPEFQFQEMFPSGKDSTTYRKLSSDFVGTAKFNGKDVLTVEPEGLTLLTAQAFKDISHLLRPGLALWVGWDLDAARLLPPADHPPAGAVDEDLRHTVERPGALQECEPHARAHEPRFEECVTPRSAVEDRGLAEQVKATPDVPYKPFVENQRLVVLFTRAAGTVDSVAALDS